MAILIDPPAWPAHGTLFSHLVSDSDYEELHVFARLLGVPRRAFDLDHYDVPASLYGQAVEQGARPVLARDIVAALRGSGLRVRQIEREAVHPLRRRQYLLAEWSGLGKTLGVAARESSSRDWQRLGDELVARWNEPHRSYHDERHLEDVLLALDQLSLRGERLSPETLLAAWFHDAVYRGAAGSDEQDSARLAVEQLSAFELAPGLVRQVGEYIVATVPAGSAGEDRARRSASPAGHEQLLDADLSIFAASPSRYLHYTQSVRTEYAHVPDEAFAAGRGAILAAYLEQPAIYRTRTAQQLWERRARANVQRELAALRGASGEGAARG